MYVCVVAVCGRGGGNVQKAFGHMALSLSEVCRGARDIDLDPSIDHPQQFLGTGPNISH